MKIGKQKPTRFRFGFRFSEDREEEERKKNKKRPASGGGRRQAPDTRRPPAGATQLQRGVDTCRLHAGPNRNASRADRTGPGPTRDCAELGARGRRACSLRLAPSRARGHALPACCWARERAWNGQFGPVVFLFSRFLSRLQF